MGTSKEVHSLIPGTCEYINLHGKTDFADEIKLGILRWEDYPGYSKLASCEQRREAGDQSR